MTLSSWLSIGSWSKSHKSSPSPWRKAVGSTSRPARGRTSMTCEKEACCPAGCVVPCDARPFGTSSRTTLQVRSPLIVTRQNQQAAPVCSKVCWTYSGGLFCRCSIVKKSVCLYLVSEDFSGWVFFLLAVHLVATYGRKPISQSQKNPIFQIGIQRSTFPQRTPLFTSNTFWSYAPGDRVKCPNSGCACTMEDAASIADIVVDFFLHSNALNRTQLHLIHRVLPTHYPKSMLHLSSRISRSRLWFTMCGACLSTSG